MKRVFDKIREKEFPITKDYIYLNHAAVSPMPQKSFHYFNDYAIKNMKYGSIAVDDNVEVAEEVREKFAKFINAEPSEIAFTKNTTSSLIIAANSISYESGDNIVLIEHEFPANIYPWLNKKDKGVEIRFVPMQGERILADEIIKYCDKRTKVISISFVEFHNGFRNEIKKLSEFTRSEGIFLCVDGIQGIGAIKFDVKETPIDFLAVGVQKWLLGPEGLGFLYVNKNILDKIRVPNPGWLRREDFFNFFNIEQKLVNTAMKFEEGALNFSAIYLFKGSIELFLELGIGNIEKKIFELNDYLINGLKAKGYNIVTPIDRIDERSGIISFRNDRIDIDKLYNDLSKKKIVCSLRNNCIRISPHFYNNFDDIKFLLDNL